MVLIFKFILISFTLGVHLFSQLGDSGIFLHNGVRFEIPYDLLNNNNMTVTIPQSHKSLKDLYKHLEELEEKYKKEIEKNASLSEALEKPVDDLPKTNVLDPVPPPPDSVMTNVAETNDFVQEQEPVIETNVEPDLTPVTEEEKPEEEKPEEEIKTETTAAPIPPKEPLKDSPINQVTNAPPKPQRTTDVSSLLVRANLSFKSRDFKQTLNYLDQAEALNPMEPLAKAMKGSLLYILGFKALAKAKWKESLALNPDQSEIKVMMLQLENEAETKSSDGFSQGNDVINRTVPNTVINRSVNEEKKP